MRAILFALACAALVGCGTMKTAAEDAAGIDPATGGRKSGRALKQAIAVAAKHPLGSPENPIRVSKPAGQRAYLLRLRCKDGKAPQYGRVGNFGFGVFGSIVDGFWVYCENGDAEGMLYMDMYHPDHDEQKPPPGFAIAKPSFVNPNAV